MSLYFLTTSTFLAALATLALANEYHVIGAAAPPTITVHAGDTLVLAKPIGRELKTDGSRDKKFTVWIDRNNGKGWLMAGATKLKFDGYVAGKGYVYEPLDAVPVPVATQAKPALFGVNLSGCEFAGVETGTLCPNVDDVNWYAAAGFKMFRIPVKATTQLTKITPAIDAALAKGITVAIDWHEYQWPTLAQQVAFWRNYAKYKANPLVIFDLQNEPKGFDSTTQTNDWMQWAEDTKAIIAALRTDGVTNTIAVEWPQYSATFRFDKGDTPANEECGSAVCALDRIGGLGDANVIYEGHRYYDRDNSGTSATCAIYGLDPAWRLSLAKRGLRGFLGESAFGNYNQVDADTGCQKLGKDAIAEIQAHPETYLGVTWWGGGSAWGAGYLFAVAPKGHMDPTSWLVRTLAGK